MPLRTQHVTVLVMEAVAGDKQEIQMKHSELINLETKPLYAHGIIIDDAPDSFALNLKEIGIIANLENGGLSFDVIDTCIGYIANNIKVVLELPFESNYPADSLVIEAMSTQFDISVLPPYTNDRDSKSWEEYKNKLLEYTKAWLSQPNNRQMVYPISGFLGYMVGEVFGYMPDQISTDPYIKSVFVDNIPLEIMDSIKDEIRVVIYDAFDGKEGFEQYAHSLASGVLESYPRKEQ